MRVVNGRRWVRVALVLGVAAAFTSRGEAQQGAAVEVEATPYGGSATGHLPPTGLCAFSPTIGTAFGGLGARARVRAPSGVDNPAERWTATAQVAVEAQSHVLLAAGSDGQRNVPRDQAMAAGAVALGHDWRYVGFDVGLGAREVFNNPVTPSGASFASEADRHRAETYETTRGAFYPTASLRVGRLDGFHVETGFGAYSPALLLRPGLHLGIGYATAAGHEVMLRLGGQVTSYDNVLNEPAPRIDVSGAWPINRRVVLGAGVAAVTGEGRVDFDGRASVTLRFGP
jgi:hypothetical protein